MLKATVIALLFAAVKTSNVKQQPSNRSFKIDIVQDFAIIVNSHAHFLPGNMEMRRDRNVEEERRIHDFPVVVDTSYEADIPAGTGLRAPEELKIS